MRRVFQHPWGWASAAPALCAVHCAVTPLLVLFAPALAPGESVEFALYGITVVVASWAMAKGLQQHGDLRPVLPIAVGLLFWGASILLLFHPIPEELTTIIAAVVVASALVWNSRLQCAANAESACACQVCEVGSETLTAPETKVVPAPGPDRVVAPTLRG
jgi:hypothetical protein